ncbi:MAG TPA: pitrilysin family protein [Gemmatimonadales bacterium]|nr:pitrilysin family protein [Gemmatimonadales bacterium]
MSLFSPRRSHWAVAVLALGALAVSPPRRLGAQTTQLSLPFSIDTLPNGLTLIIHQDRSVPTVAVNVWYHVGSGDERVGRTGFAHLFEHLMFMGSQHAEYPAFDRLLEAAGANNNGSTTEDRTNYYESGPRTALPLMLWLEADRMGWLLPTMDSAKVDLQRDVVKNERRERLENAPYGIARDHLPSALYPAGHPYSWPVIGSMRDLTAASVEDVKNFFRMYYAPNNATLVVAGDVDPAEVRRLVRQYFGDIPRGPTPDRPPTPSFQLRRDTTVVLEDRVQLPRLYLNWHTIKAYTPDDAALNVLGYLLTGAKNARLTQALVYDRQVATNVFAGQNGALRDGDFSVITTAKPGTPLDTLQAIVDREVARLIAEGPTARELDQARNSLEASQLRQLENVDAKADQLNSYYYFTGNPDYLSQDLANLRGVTAADVQRVARQYLQAPRVTLSVVPQGRPELAATRGGMTP